MGAMRLEYPMQLGSGTVSAMGHQALDVVELVFRHQIGSHFADAQLLSHCYATSTGNDAVFSIGSDSPVIRAWSTNE